MVELNDRIISYMQKQGWKDIVLNVELMTSWCAPPYLEVVVSFTDEEKEAMLAKGYLADQSELGVVYYPQTGVRVEGQLVVKYVEYPWITCFEVDGLVPDKEE